MKTEIYQNLLAQLDKLARHNRQGSYKTRERYYQSMQRFCRFAAERYRLEKLANISPKHIRAYTQYMKDKDLSASTIKTDLAAIRFWHDKLSNPRTTLPDNAELSLTRRKFGGVNRAWTPPEFNRFIAVCWRNNREDYAAMACLARYAGLRISECFRLDRAAAERAVKTMNLTVKGKNGKIRTVPINESIRIELEKMLSVTQRGHKLFVPEDSQTDTEIKNLQKFIEEHRAEFQSANAPRPRTFHGLRHTYAQEQYLSLKKTGLPETGIRRKLSKLLGHERVDVVQIYLAGLEEVDADV